MAASDGTTKPTPGGLIASSISPWSRGVRINLVLNNYGQASPKSDREWKGNPYSREMGDPAWPATSAAQAPLRWSASRTPTGDALQLPPYSTR